MDRTPLLLVGDGPNEPTGLGRIARDLGCLLAQSDLPIDLLHLGGPILPLWDGPYRQIPLHTADRSDDWGAAYTTAVYQSAFGDRPGVIWYLWDPARIWYHLQYALPVQRWGYCAIDGANRAGTLGGPGGEAIQRLDRVLGYGRWGSSILRTRRDASVPYLPHGLSLGPSAAPPTDAERSWVQAVIGPHRRRGTRLVGAVATNQTRKDLGLVMETLAALRARGHAIYAWLHTDVLVKAWSVPQLIEDCGLAKQLTVTTADSTFTDRQLALLYQACDVTIAPGLGEGFGYPIVESLAAGTPVIHADWAGGRELVPKREWRIPVRATRLDGIYAVQRPLLLAEDAANAIERVWAWQTAIGREAAAAYCRGSVAHLEWSALWGRWQAWIRKGLVA